MAILYYFYDGILCPFSIIRFHICISYRILLYCLYEIPPPIPPTPIPPIYTWRAPARAAGRVTKFFFRISIYFLIFSGTFRTAPGGYAGRYREILGSTHSRPGCTGEYRGGRYALANNTRHICLWVICYRGYPSPTLADPMGHRLLQYDDGNPDDDSRRSRGLPRIPTGTGRLDTSHCRFHRGTQMPYLRPEAVAR